MQAAHSDLGIPLRRHHFSLGIDQASPEPNALRCPGFYAVVADSTVQAARLAWGMMQAQSAHTRGDWLAPGERALKATSALPADSGPAVLTQWSLPEKRLKEALLELPEDFSGVRRKGGKPRLILLEIPAVELAALELDILRHWCWRWRLWLAHRNCCLLLLAQGEHDLVLRERLEGCNDTIDGLLHLQPNDEEAHCHLHYWRSDFGVSGADDMLLTATESGWRRRSAVSLSTQGSHDEHIYLVQSIILKDVPNVPGHWNVVESADDILAQASHAQAATVMLAVERVQQIEPLARRLHDLRKTRGSALKLVVCEISPCLRYRDERLLLLCGISMVMRFEKPFSHFLSRLDAIQGQRFMRPVTDDLEALLKTMHPEGAGGCCSPARFLEEVQHWLDGDSATLISSLMLVLQPSGELTPEQLIARARLHRQGDLISLMEGRIYLFLFGCRRSASETALKSLFGLPAISVFGERQEFDEPASIADEVERLTHFGWAQHLQLPHIPDEDASLSMMFGGENHQESFKPRPVTLKLADGETEKLAGGEAG